MKGICELCKRIKELTFHHYIPKSLHSNKFFIKLYTKKFMRKYGISVCSECHKTIHSFWNEKELAKFFNSKEKLLKNDKFLKYINWVKKQS